VDDRDESLIEFATGDGKGTRLVMKLKKWGQTGKFKRKLGTVRNVNLETWDPSREPAVSFGVVITLEVRTEGQPVYEYYSPGLKIML
jgi:hypothetical protein